MSFLGTLFKKGESKKIKALWPVVEKINALEPEFIKLSDEDLKKKTSEFKERVKNGEKLDDILPEAFSAVREAAKRTLGQRHFDVQLIGGAILHHGNISEMKTGEGKTLVATLPAYLNALSGDGVHVITVNDYLSRRDGIWMGQVYNALGLSVGILNHDSSFLYDPTHKPDEKQEEVESFKVLHEFLRPCTRRESYHADITYGTNNEFGFDYLRDNLEYQSSELRQREHNFAVIDEVDSILIDEARTPLIISSPTTDSEHFYDLFTKIVRNLNKDEDFTVDEKRKAIQLTDAGISKAEKALGIENIYTEGGIKYVHHLETAVRAKALFELNKDYVVKEGEIVIVDEFTGRLQPGRRWSEGLHQAIESKEGVKIQKESRTFASITFQNYFRLYKKISGMTGTALTSEEEFFKVYKMEVVSIPTNKTSLRKDFNDQIYQSEIGKFKAVAKFIKEKNKIGQPVLIGTVSIEKNEVLSKFLEVEGIKHQVLNAKNHEKEGEIIAEAGKFAAVTVATNMAGRGVDIKLGGPVFNKEENEKIKNLGGLCVIGTERHDARRIDNQLRGRSGRQGDSGETHFFVSLEDNLMRIFASDTVKNMMKRFNIPEDQPIESSLITRSLENAQTKIEGFNFDARKHVLEYDDVLNFQRKTIYGRRMDILNGTTETLKEKFAEIVKTEDEEKMISEKIQTLGEEQFYQSLKPMMLQSIDTFWVDHLEMMDYLRGSVNLRAYGQRDPLVEYKKDGLRLFKEMQEIISLIPHMGVQVKIDIEKNFKTNAPEESLIQNKAAEIGGQKIGRNDPCPCGAINPETGSAYKYKNCGMINALHHQR